MATPEKLKEIKDEYLSSLTDLTINSKPLINMLTMLAEDYLENAAVIVNVVEEHLTKVRSEFKLPVLYLIDSIVKNVGKDYTAFFAQNLVSNFCSVFEKVDERVRAQMFKLRQTWNDVFSQKKLYILDCRVHSIDPAWPITALPPTPSIHVNPKFFNKSAAVTPSTTDAKTVPSYKATVTKTAVASNAGGDSTVDMRAQLIMKQKELLELQQRKIELELFQAKVKLEEQQKQMDSGTKKSVTNTLPSMKSLLIKPSAVPEKQHSVKSNKSHHQNIPASFGSKANNGPRIAPVNSALIASARPLSRDPRLAAKQALSTTAPESSPTQLVDNKTTKHVIDAVNLNQSNKQKSILSASSITVNKVGASDCSALSTKDPSLFKKGRGPADTGREKQQSSGVRRAKVASPQKVSVPLASVKKPEKRQNNVVNESSKTVVSSKNGSKNRSSSRSPVKPSKSKDSLRKKADSKHTKKRTVENSLPEAVVTKPPSPVVEKTAGFKELRSSTKNRNYVRRNREKSDSPENLDVDLRVVSGPPPEKQPRLQTASPPSSPASNDVKNQPVIVDVTTTNKDVDLRQLPPPLSPAASKKRLSSDKSDGPSPKKSKAEIFDVLFGNEDVDLRTLPSALPPVQPPTPPPPIISSPSTSTDGSVVSNKENGGWAKVKENKSPVATSSAHLASVRAKLANATNKDRLGRPLLYNKLPDDPNERRRSISNSIEDDMDWRKPKKSDDTSIKVILQQAEEEHKSGTLSQSQYHVLMTQIIRLIETKKLHEAQQKEATSTNQHNVTLQPISDDEMSTHFSSSEDDDVEIVNVKTDNPPMPRPRRRVKLNPPPAPVISKSDPDKNEKGRMYTRLSERKPSIRVWDNKIPWERPARPNPWIQPPVGIRAGLWQQTNNFVPPQIPSSTLPPPQIVDARLNVAIGGYVQAPPVSQYLARTSSPPAIGMQTNRELPQADSVVLEYINNDVMKTINIDGIPREIRFYGDTAIVIMSWDDPREISFQAGQRRIYFDKESYLLSFNDTYSEITIGGVSHKVRLGAPTRELYIDNKWYECYFGGPGIGIEIDGTVRIVKFDGPPPQVKIGTVKRTDLCAGRINLIIDARTMIPIFLDAKPQKFDIEGKFHTLRFMDALKTVLINNEPFRVEFGGLPKPIMVHNKKHFIRFSVLPRGVRPGYVDIKDMEGQKMQQEIEPVETPEKPVVVAVSEPSLPVTEPVLPIIGTKSVIDVKEKTNVPVTLPDMPVISSTIQQPPKTLGIMDLLSSVMPATVTPSSNTGGYQVEPSTIVPSSQTSVEVEPTPVTLDTTLQQQQSTASLLPSAVNIEELFQKLVATGIVSNPTTENKPEREMKTDDSKIIKPVMFEKSETLKVKQPAIVTVLYSGMQCSSCGVRFPPEHTMRYSQHLDWHFRQNRRERHSARKASSRKWYYDVSDWIQFEEIEDLEEREKNWFENQQAAANAEGTGSTGEDAGEEIDIPSVEVGSAGERPRCEVCHDTFDQFYNEEKDEWHLRMAIRVDEKLYHPVCYEDFKARVTEDVVRDEKPLNESTDLTTKDISDIVVNLLEDASDVDEEMEPIDVNVKKDESDDLMDMSDAVIEIKEEKIIIDLDDTDDLETAEDGNSLSKEEEANEIELKRTKDGLLEGVVVKTEPVDEFCGKSDMKTDGDLDMQSNQSEMNTDNTQAAVVSSIDGNVQLEATPDMGPAITSGKIKINISKPISVQLKEPVVTAPVTITPDSVVETSHIDVNEPPPPGEEPVPQVKLKPTLQGISLTKMPSVKKGNELSGLCSIM